MKKQDYWQHCCDTLTDSTKLTSVWRMSEAMNGLNTAFSLSSFEIQGMEYNNNKDKATQFADQFIAIAAKSNYTPDFISLSTFVEIVLLYLFFV